VKPPKDIAKYIPSWVAGIRLIDLALQQILCRRNAHIKWELKLFIYYSPEDIKKSKATVLPVRGTFSSGDYVEPEQAKEKP
jgi:hypothetical protein